ncbi:MAG TPA: M24 family metallopeptidase [Gemmatimonadales bacterium]|nr:M24 family metallopeptidase [Gemmatimonadales bacterium]
MPLCAHSVACRSVSCFACSCRLLQCAFLRRSASTPQGSRPGASGSARPRASGLARWQRPSRARSLGCTSTQIAAAARYVNTRMGAGRGVSAHRPRRAARADRALLMDHTRQRQAGELVDYGLRLGLRLGLEYYTSDITRTWAVSGRFTAEHEGRYRRVLKARKPFVAGTVFNVEPILELPDRKIRIRLEDTIGMTENGAENVTASMDTRTPKPPPAVSDEEERWLPRPYCLAATPGTGYCGVLRSC